MQVAEQAKEMRGSIHAVIGVLLSILALCPLIVKAIHVDEFVLTYTGVRLLGFVQSVVNDAVIYGGMLGLIYVSRLKNMPYAAVVSLRIAVLAVFLIYVVDLIVIKNFNTHLTVNDAYKYASYSLDYIDQIYGEKNLLFLIVGLALAAVVLYCLTGRFVIQTTRQHKVMAIALGGFFLVAGFASKDYYVHSWIYKNVIDYNLTIWSESAAYSPTFKAQFQYQPQEVCEPHQPQRQNIILLMVESLSAYQSRLFSGINDWTPELDKIARENRYFPNFYANGFITEDGEIALLTGLLPIYAPANYSDGGGVSFAGFYHVKQSLPNRLKKRGYQTEFLTTADLDFAETGVWADSIGFDYVEGDKHPYYQQWERFHFNAAPDAALFQRLLDRVGHQRKPFFIFAKTVSTHHPFIDPESKNQSESAVFAYTDKQLGLLYAELKKAGFFENGLLIIVGDHHSMTPITKPEIQRYGPLKAPARIPLIVADGKSDPAVDNAAYQQVDVFNSINNSVSEQKCHSEWRGDLFGDAGHPARYIAHRRGDHRDMISVFTPETDYLIKLNGDRTAVVMPDDPEPNTARAIVDRVNWLRLSAI